MVTGRECRPFCAVDAPSSQANVKDVCLLIDMKSNITDVNSALAELQRGIDARAPLEELRRIVREQAVINASLCADCRCATAPLAESGADTMASFRLSTKSFFRSESAP